MNHNFTLLETLTYQPTAWADPAIQERVLEALAKLQAFEEIEEDPDDLAEWISDLEDKAAGCNNEDHACFDDYKQFFEDVVERMEEWQGRWPCAEPWQSEVIQAVFEVIDAGGEALAKDAKGD